MPCRAENHLVGPDCRVLLSTGGAAHLPTLLPVNPHEVELVGDVAEHNVLERVDVRLVHDADARQGRRRATRVLLSRSWIHKPSWQVFCRAELNSGIPVARPHAAKGEGREADLNSTV